MKKHGFYQSIWNIKYISKGKTIWSIEKQNALADQGEETILETVFRKNSTYTPSAYYVRLCNSNLIETDVLIGISNEPSGNGYSPQLIEASTTGFPTKDTFEGDYRLISKEVVFTASGGDIGPVSTMYLSTTNDNSGKLFAFLSLPMIRTILNGDSMIVQFEVILK